MWLRPIAGTLARPNGPKTHVAHDNRKQIGTSLGRVGGPVRRPHDFGGRRHQQYNVLHTFTFAIHIHASVDQGCLYRVGPTRSYP
jgi:hypothetical protein